MKKSNGFTKSELFTIAQYMCEFSNIAFENEFQNTTREKLNVIICGLAKLPMPKKKETWSPDETVTLCKQFQVSSEGNHRDMVDSIINAITERKEAATAAAAATARASGSDISMNQELDLINALISHRLECTDDALANALDMMKDWGETEKSTYSLMLKKANAEYMYRLEKAVLELDTEVAKKAILVKKVKKDSMVRLRGDIEDKRSLINQKIHEVCEKIKFVTIESDPRDVVGARKRLAEFSSNADRVIAEAASTEVLLDHNELMDDIDKVLMDDSEYDDDSDGLESD